MSNTQNTVTPQAAIAHASSEDNRTSLVAWSDGSTSIFQHESLQPEPDGFMKLDKEAVQELRDLLNQVTR